MVFDKNKIDEELLQAKIQTKKSEGKLKAALESMSDAIFISDKEGNFIDFNEAFATFHKFKSKEECARNLKEFPAFLDVFSADGEFVPIEMWVVSKALRGETGINEEFTLKRKDTDETWVGSYNYSPIRNNEGNIIGSIVTARDITARIKTENKLLESKERFKIAMNATKDGLFDWNLVTNEVYYSPGWKSMLGYKDEELPNNLTIWEKLTKKEDVERTWKMQQELIGKQRDHFKIEFKMKHKDGHWIDVLSRAEVIFDDKGKAVRMVGTHVDITERKKSEEELRSMNTLLEELYVNQFEEIENERKLISREIHDELGQALSALKIDLEWTNDHLENNADTKKKINGMVNIVSDTIKTVQRISSDLRPGILDDLGLTPAIDWHSKEFEQRTGIKISLNLDEIQFNDENKNLTTYRVLQEALTNIMRHANAKNVIINLKQNKETVVLEVIDDGIGIPAEKVRSGKSLGIKGIKERVKQFNGAFKITSNKNKGSKLSITIPHNLNTK